MTKVHSPYLKPHDLTFQFKKEKPAGMDGFRSIIKSTKTGSYKRIDGNAKDMPILTIVMNNCYKHV